MNAPVERINVRNRVVQPHFTAQGADKVCEWSNVRLLNELKPRESLLVIRERLWKIKGHFVTPNDPAAHRQARSTGGCAATVRCSRWLGSPYLHNQPFMLHMLLLNTSTRQSKVSLLEVKTDGVASESGPLC